MTAMNLDLAQTAALTALANSIIPADEFDAGAATVQAGAVLAEKVRSGINASLYLHGLAEAEVIAQEQWGKAVRDLNAQEIYRVIGTLQQKCPVFFKQFRMDVATLYLSDPGVWQRIGFPGPSTATGGYPDFDRPQKNKYE